MSYELMTSKQNLTIQKNIVSEIYVVTEMKRLIILVCLKIDATH